MTVPVWLAALLLAAAAPTIVRLVADGIERRVRRRTDVVLARALARTGAVQQTEVGEAGAPRG